MKAFTLCIALATCGALSACNTMQGLGQDINRLGSSIENSANHNKKIARPAQNNSASTPNPNESSMQQHYPVAPMETKDLDTIPYEKY